MNVYDVEELIDDGDYGHPYDSLVDGFEDDDDIFDVVSFGYDIVSDTLQEACPKWINTLNEGEVIWQAGKVLQALRVQEFALWNEQGDYKVSFRLNGLMDMLAERLGHLTLVKTFRPERLLEMLEEADAERQELLREVYAAKHAVAEAAAEAAVAKIIKSPEDEYLAVLK